jgi:hypothetical protein
MQTGEHLLTFEGHGDFVTCLFVEEGRVYTGSDDETFKIWDIEVHVIKEFLTFHRMHN